MTITPSLLGTSVAVAVFNQDRSQVLLVKRKDVPVWVLPGGGIDPGESAETAAIRECEEETGYKVIIKKKVGDYYPANKLTKFTYVFECEIVGGAPSICDETLDIRFFPVSKLPRLMPPPFQEWIHDAFQNYPTILSKTMKSVTYFVFIKKLVMHPTLVLKFIFLRIKHLMCK